MRLLVDDNLSLRVAEGLREAGHDAVHVIDAGLRNASDKVILAAVDDAGQSSSRPSLARLATCRDAAAVYDLTSGQARELIDHAVDSIVASWDEAADSAKLTQHQRQQMWGTQVFNPYAFHDYGPQPN